jgi:Cu-processing system permease protein
MVSLLRSRWIWGYFLLFAIVSFGLFHYSPTLNGGMGGYLNVVVLVIPLLATIIGSLYYYNNYDFTLMMLTQPLSRTAVLLGQLWALIAMLALGFLGGTLLGVVWFAFDEVLISQLVLLLAGGLFLIGIFCALAYLLALRSSDKLRGMGAALGIWLFMAIIYDGLLLAYLYAFGQYPVEHHAVVFTLINPIDLSRVAVMLHMDVAALMGYTGAVFKSFFGSTAGLGVAAAAMVAWLLLIHVGIWLGARKKDF